MAKPRTYFVECPECGEVNKVVNPAEAYNGRPGPEKREVERVYPCRKCGTPVVVPWVLTRERKEVG